MIPRPPRGIACLLCSLATSPYTPRRVVGCAAPFEVVVDLVDPSERLLPIPSHMLLAPISFVITPARVRVISVPGVALRSLV